MNYNFDFFGGVKMSTQALNKAHASPCCCSSFIVFANNSFNSREKLQKRLVLQKQRMSCRYISNSSIIAQP